MARLRLEHRKAGLAIVADGRAAPVGYVRGGKWRMKCGDGYEEFSAEDLEGIARKLREMSKLMEREGRTTWRV